MSRSGKVASYFPTRATPRDRCSGFCPSQDFFSRISVGQDARSNRPAGPRVKHSTIYRLRPARSKTASSGARTSSRGFPQAACDRAPVFPGCHSGYFFTCGPLRSTGLLQPSRLVHQKSRSALVRAVGFELLATPVASRSSCDGNLHTQLRTSQSLSRSFQSKRQGGRRWKE